MDMQNREEADGLCHAGAEGGREGRKTVGKMCARVRVWTTGNSLILLLCKNTLQSLQILFQLKPKMIKLF